MLLLLFGLLDWGSEGCFLNRLGHVVLILLAWSEAEFLSLVVIAEALWVLIQACEASRLLIRFDTLQLNDLSSWKHIGKLNRSATLFLVFYDFLNAFFNWIALGGTLVVKISLIRILITLYKRWKSILDWCLNQIDHLIWFLEKVRKLIYLLERERLGREYFVTEYQLNFDERWSIKYRECKVTYE